MIIPRHTSNMVHDITITLIDAVGIEDEEEVREKYVRTIFDFRVHVSI